MPPRVKKSKQKVYAVRRGHKLGAFATWDECEEHTRGFAGREFKSFATLEQAMAYLAEAGVVIDRLTVPEPEAAAAAIATNQARLTAISDLAPRVSAHVAHAPVLLRPRRIYCDGGQNKQTGNEAWGCVVDQDSADLVYDRQALLTDLPLRIADLPVATRWVLVSRFEDVAYHHNNGAELMALLVGARIAKTIIQEEPATKSIIELCTDSKTALAWSLSVDARNRSDMDPRKLAYIDELIALRKQLGARVTFLKISGDDNLADLGFH
jgi:ribonuclease HI